MRSFFRGVIFLLMLVFAHAGAVTATETTASNSQGSSSAAPEVVDVGIYLLSVYDLSHGAESYLLDFYIWFRWKGDIDPTKSFEFANMVDNSSATVERIGEEPDILANGVKYQIFRVEGRFVEPSTFFDYPFDRQQLTIKLEDSTYASDRLVYRFDGKDTGIDQDLIIPGWELASISTISKLKNFNTRFGSDKDKPTYSRAVFTLSVERPSSVFYWKLMLPLTFIFVAALAALLLPPPDIDSRSALIGGGLLTTVFLQKTYSDLLPDIDYLVLMDKIYIVAYIGIITALIQVVHSYLKVRVDEGAESGFAKLDRNVFVGLLLSFSVLSTAIVVYR